MSRTNKILAVVLALQFVILGVRAVWPDSSNKEIAPGGALVTDFDPSTITQITIADNTDKQITLKKTDDAWVLPDFGDYPVESSRVATLLDKIMQIRADRLITQSETSFRRLQVSPDDFVRLVTFEQADGDSQKLYVGKTGGGNTTHVRLDAQSQVYLTNNLTAQDANAQPSGWINTVYFSASADDVVSLTLHNANGTFEFTKDGDTWTVSGLAEGETLNQGNFTQLLNAIASLRMTAPISKDVQDDFGMDAPQAEITLTVLETEAPETGADVSQDMSNLLAVTPVNGATSTPTATPQNVERDYVFQIGAALDNGVVVKGSNSDYFVLISQATADRFITKTQADFTTVPPTPTPEPPTETVVPGGTPTTPVPQVTETSPTVIPTPG
jgi:hypothetical protein